MSTEFTNQDFGADELVVNPTSSWANVDGAVKVDSLIAPIYVDGKIFAFAQDSTDTLDLFMIDYTGTGVWFNYTYAAIASPAVAAPVTRANKSYMGVARLVSNTGIQVSYIPPAGPQSANVKQATIPADGLANGTHFAGPLQIAKNSINRFEVFALDNAGNLWQTMEADDDVPAKWSRWAKIGKDLSRSAKEFRAILMTGGQNNDCIQVVAVDKDGKVRQATQTQGQVGSYGQFAVVGSYDNLSSSTRFTPSPAAVFGPSIKNMVYAAYNESPLNPNDPLDYFVGGTSSNEWEVLDTDSDPKPVSVPVLAASTNKVYLTWMAEGGQFYLTSSTGSLTSYWGSSHQKVGRPDSSFTGNVTAVANDNNVGLFQVLRDGTVAFINFQPS